MERVDSKGPVVPGCRPGMAWLWWVDFRHQSLLSPISIPLASGRHALVVTVWVSASEMQSSPSCLLKWPV